MPMSRWSRHDGMDKKKSANTHMATTQLTRDKQGQTNKKIKTDTNEPNETANVPPCARVTQVTSISSTEVGFTAANLVPRHQKNLSQCTRQPHNKPQQQQKQQNKNKTTDAAYLNTWLPTLRAGARRPWGGGSVHLPPPKGMGGVEKCVCVCVCVCVSVCLYVWMLVWLSVCLYV